MHASGVPLFMYIFTCYKIISWHDSARIEMEVSTSDLILYVERPENAQNTSLQMMRYDGVVVTSLLQDLLTYATGGE